MKKRTFEEERRGLDHNHQNPGRLVTRKLPTMHLRGDMSIQSKIQTENKCISAARRSVVYDVRPKPNPLITVLGAVECLHL